jgi:methylmalonyl-CoA/ethylmalonyl-CoA epimerase
MRSTDVVLARVGSGLFQQAFVVDDVGAAQDAFRRAIGCEQWVTLPATPLRYRYRGRDVECALELAFARSGDVQIELIRPVSGEGLHVEFLATHGPGAHHLGFLVGNLDDEVAVAGKEGFDAVMGGVFGSLRFVYLDTWDALGTFMELVEDPDGMMRQLMPWRDSASP